MRIAASFAVLVIMALGVAALVAALVAATAAPPSSSPPRSPSPGPAGGDGSPSLKHAGERSESPLMFEGVGSCSAIACHGGPVDAGRGDLAWKSAYTVWARRDPHARAYRTLFTERSRRMVQRLRGLTELSQAAPHKEQTCLACHSPIDAALPAEEAAHVLRGDGVSCEACHGAAKRWLVEHTTTRWDSLPPGERYGPRFGMTNTQDMAARAAACAQCHVGSAASGDGPARDVNHDLIAAGHPRLNFEFSAYLANMPRHWHVTPEERAGPESEARAWGVGQAVAAQSALRLLESRAAAASAALERGDHVAWPEFAEYDCFACHHALHARSAPPERARPGDRLGAYRWGTWPYARIDFLGERLGAADGGKFRTGDFGPLAAAMAQPFPDVTAVRAHVREAIGQVDSLAKSAAATSWTAAEVDAWLAAAVRRWDEARPVIWDDATQWFLAVSALHGARLAHLESAGRMPTPADDEMRRLQHEAIRPKLEFTSRDKPPAGGGAAPAAIRFDSPRDFDPQALAEEVARLAAAARGLVP
jgi:hypothetical protein